jgi:hypothetical protein
MASSSSRALISSLAVVSMMSLTLGGCLTGTLIESGRLHERVTRYERIAIDGDDLVLDYTVTVSKSPAAEGPRSGKSEQRAAILSIEGLDARPPHPVDAFPLRRVSTKPRTGTPMPIRITSDDHGDRPSRAHRRVADTSDASDTSKGSGAFAVPSVEITERVGRHLGFRLCPGHSNRGMTKVNIVETDDACLGYFHSAALYDDHLTWWVYPAIQFAIALDLALIPIQVLTAPPLLLVSD